MLCLQADFFEELSMILGRVTSRETSAWTNDKWCAENNASGLSSPCLGSISLSIDRVIASKI